MSLPGTKLANQQLKYDEVNWNTETYYDNAFATQARECYINKGLTVLRKQYGNAIANQLVYRSGSNNQPLKPIGTTTTVITPPQGLSTGMEADKDRPPYWTFSHVLDETKGLVLTDINVKDTVSSGSVEEVFERIEFSDLKIFFDDGTSMIFDLASALSSTTGTFVRLEEGENGYGHQEAGSCGPPDSLYQRGLKLVIVTNVLGTCYVTLAFSVVFRGAKNDFDPGGVPVAMIAWPQYAFQWSSDPPTKRGVVKFIGGIKISMNNKMHSSHMHHGVPLNENIVGLYTDSNTSIRDSFIGPLSGIGPIPPSARLLFGRAAFYSGVMSLLGSIPRLPFGWTMVFDFVSKLNMTYNKSTRAVTQREKEIVAVYGPDDGTKFTSDREQRYQWIPVIGSPGIRVKKAPRQGMYDNMHNHARMAGLDRMGNVQIHSPFCGHSCIHTHWRWSNASSWGFIYDTIKYRGWSGTEAFALVDAPKVPPNQRIRVAICNASTGNSFSDTNILNPAALEDLDPLRKTFWYRAEIIRPNAGEWQVAMEQGIGWAYRYTTPKEAVDGLPADLLDRFHSLLDTPTNFEGDDVIVLDWLNRLRSLLAPTQHDVAAFFENWVYPNFRYFKGTGPQDQVPEGNHNLLYSGSTGTSMEDL